MKYIHKGNTGHSVEMPKWAMTIERISHYVVLVLSLALIVFISYDTFTDVQFLANRTYMTFQLWVCIIFMGDFFLELNLAPDKRIYIRRRWFFLLISIPYLNIIRLFDIQFSESTLYFIRFIPLVRGAYSMAMVVGFFSTNKAFTLVAQYAFILVSAIYFMSLIFFYEEKDVNENVVTYWDSLYWACMNVTTIGSEIEAVTPVGKIGSVAMGISGMLMLPLFTVYITDRVKRLNARQRSDQEPQQ